MFNPEEIRKKTEAVLPNIIKHRRTIHANPELAFEEYKTSEYIQSYLKKLDIPFEIVAKTGVVALIGRGEKCVALRADIDALPINEATGLEFSSNNENIMHACGHDMHTAMLLGAAEVLKSYEKKLPGTVKLIFQPSEEKLPGGAKVMIENGVLDNPAPGAVFGQHVNPGEEVGKLSFAPGPVMGSADELYWTIKGKGTHAAQPHLGGDPVLTAAQIIVYMQTAQSKFRNPINPGLISIPTIHGGSAPNIFPDKVTMMGTMRSFDNDWRIEMHNMIEEATRSICSMYHTQYELEIVKGYPPLINNADTTTLSRKTAEKLFGKDAAVDFEPKMWAEDFAYYAQQVPSTFWFLGVRPPEMEEMPALHNARFSPSEEAMQYGTSMFVAVAMRYLEK